MDHIQSPAGCIEEDGWPEVVVALRPCWWSEVNKAMLGTLSLHECVISQVYWVCLDLSSKGPGFSKSGIAWDSNLRPTPSLDFFSPPWVSTSPGGHPVLQSGDSALGSSCGQRPQSFQLPTLSPHESPIFHLPPLRTCLCPSLMGNAFGSWGTQTRTSCGQPGSWTTVQGRTQIPVL